MKQYKITISVSDVGGIYNANNICEAREIAEQESCDIYVRLNGRCNVTVEDVEEV